MSLCYNPKVIAVVTEECFAKDNIPDKAEWERQLAVIESRHAGRDDWVKTMLEKDKSLASVQSEHGETPFHYAAQRGHLKAVELLLAAGADASAWDNDRDKKTPLHLAATYGHSKVVALLLVHKADRTAKDWGEKTALSHARERRDAETIRLLEKP